MHVRETLKPSKLPFKSSDLCFQESLATKDRFKSVFRLSCGKNRAGRDSPSEHRRENSTCAENQNGRNSDDACQCGSHEPRKNACRWWIAKSEDCRP